MDVSQQAVTRIPDDIDVQWAREFHHRLKAAVEDQRPLEEVLSEGAAASILARAACLLDKEPTVLDVMPSEGRPVIVVGDTHGQFLDVLHMLDHTEAYDEGKMYIFNGDLVDRGSWGVELFLSVAVLKLADPSRYFILRGNHESSWCTKMYGFKKELDNKYPHKRRHNAVGGQKLNIGSFVKVFKLLPLAAVVAETTLVLHGGLWRKPLEKKRKSGSGGRRGLAKCAKHSRKGGVHSGSGDPEWMPTSEPGCSRIRDLRLSAKGGADPLGQYSNNLMATDVLWSDPVKKEGLSLNDSRGVGLLFGPDVTKRFLEFHNMKLIVRSHEGPDARYGRDDMEGMDVGFTIDHESDAGVLQIKRNQIKMYQHSRLTRFQPLVNTYPLHFSGLKLQQHALGKLVTVFSAPDYPQHQLGDERYENKACVLKLKQPSYCEYEQITYEAVPRPPAPCFYDLYTPGSDDELNLGSEDLASDVSEGAATSAAMSVSGLTDAANDQAQRAGEGGEEGEEVSAPDPQPANDHDMKVESPSPKTSSVLHTEPPEVAPKMCTAEVQKPLVQVVPDPDAVTNCNGAQVDAGEDPSMQSRTVGHAEIPSAAIACAVP